MMRHQIWVYPIFRQTQMGIYKQATVMRNNQQKDMDLFENGVYPKMLAGK